jgi:Flp pilus assembly protein TadG
MSDRVDRSPILGGIAMTSFIHRIANQLSAFRLARGGNVAIIFALSLIPLIGIAGAGIDFSRGSSAKTDMQAALDATALMLAKNASLPGWQQAQLTSTAQSTVTALLTRPGLQNVVVTASYKSQQPPTVTVSATATLNSVFMGGVLNLLGISSTANMTIAATTTSTYGSPQTLQLNVVFDSSASMIVGATANDVTLISNWVKTNWNAVKPGDPAPNYPGGDNPPCAFACHDAGGSTQASDIATGLTNAHTAGATTRFDVMVSAGQQLISHVQTAQANNPMLKNNTYLFNVFSFDTALNQLGLNNMTFNTATQAVQSVSPGLDTHLYSVMSSLITKMGTQGNGGSAASPLKFLIMITDGLQSDRGSNWGGGYWAQDSAWNFYTHFGGYDTTIDQTQCKTLKDNGIIVAILETPYVPLTGQSPAVQPYEKTVRKVVYPGGPNTASAVSQALATCASTGYYFQASNASDIATGFLTLTDKFIYNTPYLMK